MKYKVLLGLLLQAFVSILSAQQTLRGAVVTENTKGKLEPVAFANVYWEGTNYGTSTDTNGTFQLSIPEGAKKLISSFVGFSNDTTIVSNFNRTVSVNLKRSVALETVTIEHRRRASEMSFINPIQTINMNEKELFKAACCNLSESFETNPSVDVNFTDAVTGAKQIRMLGLNGPYTMISRENMPGIRGALTAFGLGSIPGTWIHSIQVTKGVGSVVNGYESIAGQINVELQQPDLGEQTFLNLYANQAGRTEMNLIHTEKLSEHVATTVLLHGDIRPFERDVNEDGFREFPLQDQLNFINRWKFKANNGWMGQIALHYLTDHKDGGQTDELVDEKETSSSTYIPYKVDVKTNMAILWGKVGYVFSGFKYKSMGFQWSLLQHGQKSFYGLREYNVNQKSGYANWIYQSIIGNTNHQFKTGASFVYDEYDEQFETRKFDRVERIPGVFFEYTFKPSNNFTLVGGVRGDYHNIYEGFITPRLHLRYAIDEETVVRGIAGSGQRSPTALMNRQSLMASSRTFLFLGRTKDAPYGLGMEKAWNFGFNISRRFQLDYREGSIQLDFYRTVFDQQVVVDIDETAREAIFYNLNGKSFSNTAQFQLDYELIKFMDVRLAYRWVQVETEYLSGLRQQPFTAEHRFFINIGYETAENVKEANWLFDFTTQWMSEQRIPTTNENSQMNRRGTSSPSFMLLSAQITRNFNSRLAVYGGVENLLNYRQDNPILAADNPFGNEFDASMVWGPIFGRNIYAGLRWRIQEEK